MESIKVLENAILGGNYTIMSDNNTRKDARVRNYACVRYPESAPDNWKDILSGHFVPALISPLHDKDVDPQNQPKKPHYHIVLMFDGKKTKEQATEIFSSFGGVGCEVVKSIRGYARYLCHMDNPEKAQYKQEDVVCLCGADYAGIIGLAIDKYKAIGEMIDWCKEYSIYSYSDLLEYARHERFDWFRILCDCGTVVMKEYLKSKDWTDKERYK